MKKKIARMLAVLMLLTSVVIPTGGEKSACAATKIPKLYFTGGIENIKCMLETGIVQKVGKTVTATVKNVKKGNVKDITVYNYDPRVATVTGKIVTKKKSGFKVNIKKLGVTSLRVRLTLKKKQAGLKFWWMNVDVTGVRELSKKELKALSKKYPEANTHSALLKKYDSYKIHTHIYDVKGNQIQEEDTYYNQKSYYSYDKYKKDNIVQHDYYESNTGYVIFGENNDFSEYYYCELYDNFQLTRPFPDDPERLRKQIEQYDPEYGYSDGEHYYYSDVSNSKAESWIRGETIIDVKTNEIVFCVVYTKNKKGKVYKYQSQRVETAVEMPDMYQFLKYRYSAEGKKKVKWECIIDPGTQDERHISLDIQEGADIKAFFPDGYEIFMDAAGKIPFAYPVDTSKDITTYIIKTAEDGSAVPLAYKHDPMDNPKVVAEIIPDPKAVYGYVPNPASKRLGTFASYDWTDPAFVEEMRKQREDYHESISELEQMIVSMKKEGKSTEEIAKAVSTRRNEIRLEAYKDDPEGLKKLRESNLATYGDENGPTLEWLINKYKTWDVVLEKALSSNAGADAIMGLYDKYYDTYIV